LPTRRGELGLEFEAASVLAFVKFLSLLVASFDNFFVVKGESTLLTMGEILWAVSLLQNLTDGFGDK
jgi:hypothetical protein